MCEFSQHLFNNVPNLGRVAVSYHAQERAFKDGISEEMFKDALYNGTRIPDGVDSLFIDKGMIRIVVVLRPKPFRGAKLAVSVFKKQPEKKTR